MRALGGAADYNQFVFAEGLPADLRPGVFYAGPGALWTDLNGGWARPEPDGDGGTGVARNR